jgi:hypothetical protein
MLGSNRCKGGTLMAALKFPIFAIPALLVGLLFLAGPVPAQAQSPSAPADSVALDNPYVRVSRDAAPCAQAAAGSCEDRVLLAMTDIAYRADGKLHRVKRHGIAVFRAGQSYEPPRAGQYFEVVVKPGHPPVKGPEEVIPPTKNLTLYDAPGFFIYQEQLAVGDTRQRHSHAQRVEIRLNQGPQLVQKVWHDGKMTMVYPAIVNFREPMVHETHNVGDMALKNFILEFKP